MKKILAIAVLAILTTTRAAAQYEVREKSDWTINTRAWSTNYFTTAIYLGAELLVKSFAGGDNDRVDQILDQVICDPTLVFPIGIEKSGFESVGDICTPYYYAFGKPFKHLGDYAVGFDTSYKPGILGVYAGAYFKSQEVVFKQTDHNLRGNYFQPRAGLIIGGEKDMFEAGVFYDVVAGCCGSVANANKDMLKGGLGIDAALSTGSKDGKTQYILQFSMPLHNFFNEDYHDSRFNNMKRRVGYIMLTERFYL